jgi:riboflavin kinase / FMN adenylyltransferase
MNIITDQAPIPTLTQSVVTVGNFDGVHAGHAMLIKEAVSRARARRAASVVITFEPHTRLVLHPDGSPPLLSSFEEKAVLIRALGADYLVRLPFDRNLAALSAEQFVKEVLVGRFKAVELVAGVGHTFGKGRAGDKNFLHNTVDKNHFSVFVANLFAAGSKAVSSSAIRNALIAGSMDEAVSMLGHPYLILAKRVDGVKKGRALGFPTLNFALPRDPKVLPPAGVYAAELEWQGSRYKGAFYYGRCPTFSGRPLHFEMNLFDFSGPDPAIGEESAIWLHTFIRPDRTFKGEEALTAQMKQDIAAIHTFFA